MGGGELAGVVGSWRGVVLVVIYPPKNYVFFFSLVSHASRHADFWKRF